MSLLTEPQNEDFLIVDAVRRVQRRGQQPALSTYEFAKSYRGFTAAIPEFHQVWYDVLDGPDDRLLLLAPREHAKTSVVLTYALHALMRHRRLRIAIISGTDDVARGFLRDLKRELVNNQALIAAYGGPFYEKGLKWTEHEIVISGAGHGKDLSVFCASSGAQVTGRHCDLLIFDDLETTDSVQTPEARAKTRAWFAKEALPLLSPGGKAIVVGTRKHDDDLYGALIRSTQANGTQEGTAGPSPWRLLDNALSVFTGEDDAPLWPERWPKEALLRRKAELDAVDVLAWPQEYLNQPLPSETQMFRPLQWPVYAALPDDVTHFQFWDLAISSKQTSDYTAGIDIAVDGKHNIYVVDCWFGHWDFHTTQLKVKAFAARYNPQTIGIEVVQYQAAAVQELVRTSMLPVVRMHPSMKGMPGKTTVAKDKVSRARLVEARASEGKVLRPSLSQPWWSEFVQQVSYFPAGRHDDLVDALAYVVSLVAKQITDFDWIYGIHRCACGHGYRLQPPDRPCPNCGTRPEPSGVRDVYLDEPAVA